MVVVAVVVLVRGTLFVYQRNRNKSNKKEEM